MQKNKLLTKSAVVLSVVTIVASSSVLAQEKNEARFEGELSVEFESDHTFKSGDPNAEITDSYPTIGLGASWIFNQYFSVNGSFTAEPVIDAAPGADRKFGEDVGLYVEEIYAQFQLGGARLFAGKYNPSFGQAWDLTPGLYGTGFAEDYQLTERAGFGLGYSLGGSALGDMDFTANLFTVDNTELSNSFFNRRGRTTIASGGAGNTGELDNYSLTVDGRNLPFLPGIAWHVGYSHQAKGKTTADLSDENALVAGLYGSHTLSENLSFEWVGEVASIENVGGGLNNVIYYTLGGVVTFAEKFNLAVAHTTRSFDISGGSDFDDTSTQISVGMEVYDGWTVDVGYTIAEVENVESKTIGVLLAKTFEFSTAE